MDGEFWAARMSTSKRHHTLQPSQSLIGSFLYSSSGDFRFRSCWSNFSRSLDAVCVLKTVICGSPCFNVEARG